MISDNLGPMPTGETLREYLADSSIALLKRRDELLAASARIPQTLNEESARKVADYIKQVTACAKAADISRVGHKEPYLEASRGVDGFFKSIIDPLKKIKAEIEGRLNVYLNEVAAAERRRRQELERQAREEAERRAREAQEAERALSDEASLREAITAEEAEKQARADAERAAKDAEAKAAELSRTRGEYGGLATLRTEWTFKDMDRATLDLDALREHLPQDALEKAIRSFIRAGGRVLAGVTIYERTSAMVR